MKVLQIISTAYRATLEEQDDTIVWITHAMTGAGADLDVLLRGNAVNYAVSAQNAEGLSFGDWRQTRPPQLARDLAGLVSKGVDVYLADEDLRDRGLDDEQLIDGVRRIPQAELAGLLGSYDRVWHW